MTLGLYMLCTEESEEENNCQWIYATITNRIGLLYMSCIVHDFTIEMHIKSEKEKFD